MSYIVAGEKICDSSEILNSIKEAISFKGIKDISAGSKREDTLIFQILIDAEELKRELYEEIDVTELQEEDLISELLILADERVALIEDYIPEEFISYGYSYHFDEGNNEIKAIFIAIDEVVGELRLRDVSERILRSLD